jgi:hypothetical protein
MGIGCAQRRIVADRERYETVSAGEEPNGRKCLRQRLIEY